MPLWRGLPKVRAPPRMYEKYYRAKCPPRTRFPPRGRAQCCVLKCKPCPARASDSGEHRQLEKVQNHECRTWSESSHYACNFKKRRGTRRVPRIGRTFFALQVKRIANSELAFEDVMIA